MNVRLSEGREVVEVLGVVLIEVLVLILVGELLEVLLEVPAQEGVLEVEELHHLLQLRPLVC